MYRGVGLGIRVGSKGWVSYFYSGEVQEGDKISFPLPKYRKTSDNLGYNQNISPMMIKSMFIESKPSETVRISIYQI